MTRGTGQQTGGSGRDLRYYTSVYLEELTETTINLIPS